MWRYPSTKQEIDEILKVIDGDKDLFVKCPSGDNDDYYLIDAAFAWE